MGTPVKKGEEETRKSAVVRPLICQVEDCGMELSGFKEYHQRYKICDTHLKAPSVLRGGEEHRFCQQCGRFHPLGEFDADKRSCRSRLERHNQRRRKHQDTEEGSCQPCETTAREGRSEWEVFLSDNPSMAHRLKHEVSANQLLQLQTLMAPTFARHMMHPSGVPTSRTFYPLALNNLQSEMSVQSAASPFNALDKDNGLSRASQCVEHEVPWKRPRPEAKPGGGQLSPERDFDPSVAQRNLMLSRAAMAGFSASRDQPQSLAVPLVGNHSHFSNLSFDHSYRVSRVSCKLFDRAPQDIPVSAREQILQWLEDMPGAVEAFLRPGCLQLTIDIRLHRDDAVLFESTATQRLCDWLRLHSTSRFWGRGGRMIMQIGRDTVLRGTAEHMESVRPLLPRLSKAEPAIVAPGQTVRLSGPGLSEICAADDFAVHCRGYGGYLPCTVEGVRGLRPSRDSVLVTIPFKGLQPGTLWLEVSCGGYLSNALPLIVPDSAGLALELAFLLGRHGSTQASVRCHSLIADVGLAVGLASWQKSAPTITALEASILQSVLHLCNQHGLLALASRTASALSFVSSSAYCSEAHPSASRSRMQRAGHSAQISCAVHSCGLTATQMKQAEGADGVLLGEA